MMINEQIVEKARGYLGVPVRHQGKDYATGIDCVGFVTSVLEELDIPIDYEPIHHRTPSSSYLREKLDAHFDEIPLDEAKAGDLVLMRFGGRKARHIAIISEDRRDYKKGIEPKIIHALSTPTVKRVVEESLEPYKPWIAAAFRFPEENE